MKFVLGFIALILAFLVFTFPHRLIVDRVLGARLGRMGIETQLGNVTPSWPPGYAIEGLRLSRGPYGLAVDKLELGMNPLTGTVYLDADACGGSLDGNITDRGGPGGTLDIRFKKIDPSRCTALDALVVSGALSGEIRLEGLGEGKRSAVLGTTAKSGNVSLNAAEGSISGHLPAPGKAKTGSAPAGVALGSWNFTDAGVEAHLDPGGSIVIDQVEAASEGVRVEIGPARLRSGGASRVGLDGNMRARRQNDSTRSKAIIGLLPKATEGADGWRRYKISGTLDAPSLIGLR